MVFSSFIFMFRFLPLMLLLYRIVPSAWKNGILFAGSLLFYSWGEIRHLPVMLALILCNYAAGRALEKVSEPVKRKGILAAAVVFSLSFLFYYKYMAFLAGTLQNLTGISLPALLQNKVLPLGISFYTFQTMSYTIDVYRQKVKAEKDLINFGTYVVMFPQLVAGPIVKYQDVAEVLADKNRRVRMAEVEQGVYLFIFGLAKKVLLADGIGRLWTDITGVWSGGVCVTAGIGLGQASTGLVWLGMAACGLQIYFDFSGYSMMAVGLGHMLGFSFPDNFKYPYLSGSITEFWRRWHMTLSGWFLEYVYIPLGGNRRGKWITVRNLFVVWTLTGVWHGAGWNFLLWGIYYFLLLAFEKRFLSRWLEKHRILPHLYTLFFVTAGWALFVGNEPGSGSLTLFFRMFVPRSGVGVIYMLCNYGILLLVCLCCCSHLPEKLFGICKKWMRSAIAVIIFLLCIAYMAGTTNSPFLYFNF